MAEIFAYEEGCWHCQEAREIYRCKQTPVLKLVYYNRKMCASISNLLFFSPSSFSFALYGTLLCPMHHHDNIAESSESAESQP